MNSNSKSTNLMTNFEYITQDIEHLAEFLDSIEIEGGTQAEWQSQLNECSKRWLNENYKN